MPPFRFNIPPGWAATTLGTATYPRGVKAKLSEMPGATFIGLEHIEAHTMRLLDTAKTSDVKSSGSYFQAGDVLYGRLRPYLNKVYMPDFAGLASGEFIVFPKQDNLDNAYLKYFLNHWEFASFATRLNAGDRPRVDFSQLADYPLPLPPLAEQRRIVDAIETQFARLDASVAALRRAQGRTCGATGPASSGTSGRAARFPQRRSWPAPGAASTNPPPSCWSASWPGAAPAGSRGKSGGSSPLICGILARKDGERNGCQTRCA